MRELIIDGVTINDDSDAWVIAEIGNTHNGDVETAKLLIKTAAEMGCNAIKMQKKTIDKCYTKAFLNKPYETYHSYGNTYGEHKHALEFDDMSIWQELKTYAGKYGITFFATPFDIDAAHFLNDLGVPCFKIASAHITDIPLIQTVASFGKPVLISTGGCTEWDIERAYMNCNQDKWMNKLSDNVALLHCIASYPTKAEEVNLRMIKTLQKHYPCTVIGFSDHYNGIVMAEGAYLYGARIIEKHFTLDHTQKGTDHALSLEPQGLDSLIKNLRRLKKARGDGVKEFMDMEKKAISKMGKAIWPARTIKQGEAITKDNVCIKIPNDGLPPYMLDEIIGKVAREDISTSVPVTHERLN